MDTASSSTSGGADDHRLHIALIPFPGRGHINPMLALSKHLSDRDVLVSIIVTEEWADLLSSSPIHPSLRLYTFPNVLPSEHIRAGEYSSFIHAVMTKMAEPVVQLILRIQPSVDLIVSDAFLPWAPEIGLRMGVPVSAFFTQSTAELFALFDFARLDNGGDMIADLPEELEELLKYIPPTLSSPNPNIDSSSNSYNLEMIRKFVQVISWSFKSHSLLLSSFYDLEKHAIEALKSEIETSVYPIGPLISYSPRNEANNISTYINWLDSKPSSSVVYIALGSFLPVSKQQFDEIIYGLNMSEFPYLFVVRENFEEVKKFIGDKGLIVSWCDQFRVLSHPSVGGFLTHCGWNSLSEAIYNNVPMITFPIAFDQIPNSNLIVNDWRIGFELRGDNEEKVVTREKISIIVENMMNLDGKESKEIRNNMRELKHKCRNALQNNGSSDISINDFVEQVKISCTK